ncbi:unnamed protein product [Zymoseptoria tritici ST99CH_1E4]|uniref:Uncharacterized protein n=1 Tax=Zymoseptoria tritici ST99CH_1E4 TaxID=1276532 RepID=A0A2H1GJ62_ZYMTR|nr:unnamed protein product [Zymoseptoria tritici ST99CH_1E4]
MDDKPTGRKSKWEAPPRKGIARKIQPVKKVPGYELVVDSPTDGTPLKKVPGKKRSTKKEKIEKSQDDPESDDLNIVHCSEPEGDATTSEQPHEASTAVEDHGLSPRSGPTRGRKRRRLTSEDERGDFEEVPEHPAQSLASTVPAKKDSDKEQPRPAAKNRNLDAAVDQRIEKLRPDTKFPSFDKIPYYKAGIVASNLAFNSLLEEKISADESLAIKHAEYLVDLREFIMFLGVLLKRVTARHQSSKDMGQEMDTEEEIETKVKAKAKSKARLVKAKAKAAPEDGDGPGS